MSPEELEILSGDADAVEAWAEERAARLEERYEDRRAGTRRRLGVSER